jgi:hypothetical protein
MDSMQELQKVKFHKSVQKLNLDHFEIKESTNFWELVAAVNLLIHLLDIYPEQKCGIKGIIKSALKKLARYNCVSNLELELVLNTIHKMLLCLEEDIQCSFADIWEFISCNILCDVSKGCPENFHKINQKVMQSAFDLITQMLTIFPTNRAHLFNSLNTIITSMEPKKLFLTSNRQNNISYKIQQDWMKHSQETLENMVLTEFMKTTSKHFSKEEQEEEGYGKQIIEATHLSQDSRVSCGLVNLSSTCYFNSLIQQFANMDWFVEFVLEKCVEIGRARFVSSIDDGIDRFFF